MLAGAYRGRDIGERELLTHAVLVEGVRPGHDVRTLCSQPVDHMADTFSVYPDYALDEAPTCQVCLPRWERLQELRTEESQREFGRNPRRERTAGLMEGEASTGRIRGTSGRFQSSTACDFCGKSCAAEHFTDDRASGSSDGPGFYLCGRVACEKARERLEEREGFDALVRHYADQRRKNEARAARAEPVYQAPVAKRSGSDLARLMGSREGAMLLAAEKGHSMSPWRGDRSECERCGATMTFESGFGASGNAIQRGSKCEMKSNGEEYRGFSIEKIEGAVQAGHDQARVAGTHRPKTRKIGTQYLIHLEDGGTKVVGSMRAAREYIDNYVGLEPNSEKRYYVWVIGSNGMPLDEGPYGPMEFGSAKDMARIGATEGAHDRAVSIGRDPQAESFHIARQYKRGSGERVL